MTIEEMELEWEKRHPVSVCDPCIQQQGVQGAFPPNISSTTVDRDGGFMTNVFEVEVNGVIRYKMLTEDGRVIDVEEGW